MKMIMYKGARYMEVVAYPKHDCAKGYRWNGKKCVKIKKPIKHRPVKVK